MSDEITPSASAIIKAINRLRDTIITIAFMWIGWQFGTRLAGTPDAKVPAVAAPAEVR